MTAVASALALMALLVGCGSAIQTIEPPAAIIVNRPLPIPPPRKPAPPPTEVGRRLDKIDSSVNELRSRLEQRK